MVERAPQGWYLELSAFVFVIAHVLAIPIWFHEPVRAALPLWTVFSVTTAGSMVMLAYLWMTHPALRRSMHEPA